MYSFSLSSSLPHLCPDPSERKYLCYFMFVPHFFTVCFLCFISTFPLPFRFRFLFFYFAFLFYSHFYFPSTLTFSFYLHFPLFLHFLAPFPFFSFFFSPILFLFFFCFLSFFVSSFKFHRQKHSPVTLPISPSHSFITFSDRKVNERKCC